MMQAPPKELESIPHTTHKFRHRSPWIGSVSSVTAAEQDGTS